MALDHLRDFLGNAQFDATDLERTNGAIFASRWITHFCAPTFFLLAGISAYLSISRGRRLPVEAARYLIIRGVALVVLEQTILRCLGWYFHFDYQFMNGGVLFGLGISMVLLSPLVLAPPRVSLVIGLVLIGIQPLLAEVHVDGPVGTVIAVATRSRDFEPFAGYHFFVSYPPLPWFGAMALGYGLAPHVYSARPGGGRPWMIVTGVTFVVAFVAIRAGGWGDPAPWSAQPTRLFTVLSFVNVSKYPPSTAFLLLTLGVALLGLAACEARPSRLLEGFGRVPLFFYVLHIPLIHALAVAYSYVKFHEAWWLTSGPVVFWDTPLPGRPASYGLGLGAIYGVWLAFLAAMYLLCRWYDSYRRRASHVRCAA